MPATGRDCPVRADSATAFRCRPPSHEDVTYLVKLRNWLVHYTPRTVSAEDPHTLDHVRGRFADNALMAGGGNAWFPDHALGAGRAGWAVPFGYARRLRSL